MFDGQLSFSLINLPFQSKNDNYDDWNDDEWEEEIYTPKAPKIILNAGLSNQLAFSDFLNKAELKIVQNEIFSDKGMNLLIKDNVFHLSTEKEIALFDNSIPLKDKKITSEVCIHHLWFDDKDYAEKGALIKWNPAIKKKRDKEALLQALLDDKIDVIATDHAPHTFEEKSNLYFKSPSGGPLVQHALPAMLEFVKKQKISLEKVVEKMCHNPAICFKVEKRGFIKEGYFADLILLDLENPWKINKENILYKCGWSPFEGETFNAKITHTFVNGHIAYKNGLFDESKKGMRLTFKR